MKMKEFRCIIMAAATGLSIYGGLATPVQAPIAFGLAGFAGVLAICMAIIE